ncbi:MAG: TIGR02301 family protein [Hyphomicrobiales bacterium]|nr:TIGR02301 family protein [Hyphomicrobiales bacterium]MDE2116000.1 TIGR02301 family protein [Hyphomicrobiales bacterium]
MAQKTPTHGLGQWRFVLAFAMAICVIGLGGNRAEASQSGAPQIMAATQAPQAKEAGVKDGNKNAPAKADTAAPAPAPIKELPPPYEAQLLQLSQTVGIVSYLRGLCMDGDEKQWREHMAAIIDSDAKSPERRKQLIAAFNTGYGSYALSYHNCTANAKQIIARELARADQLGRDISSHYGGR